MKRPPASILIVEDQIEVRELMRDVLEGAGYWVALARNGREALAALEAITPAPSVILTDLMMPDMGGWELATRLRARPGLSAIPVVLITGSDDRIGDAIRGTFDRCLTKPLTPSKLLDLVAQFTLRRGGEKGQGESE